MKAHQRSVELTELFNRKGFIGECDKKTSFEILDFFYKSGGNFVDTANNYQVCLLLTKEKFPAADSIQKEESEIWLGEWMKERNNRDQMVVATKFTTAYRAGYGDKEIIINSTGNGTKSLHLSLEASLKKLQTTYIDLLYVHWWDFTCSVRERLHHSRVLLGGVRANSSRL